MQLEGPCRYELALSHDPSGYIVRCPNGSHCFSGLGSLRVPKLYVVAADVEGQLWPVYVGVTRQRMGERFRYGWTADGRSGYHGYAFRHKLTTAVVDVWAASEATGDAIHDMETVEAELVFLIRQQGQWPLHQTEIHFHPSEERHRRAAAHILDRYASAKIRTTPDAAADKPRARIIRNTRQTTKAEFVNRNRQQNVRALGIPGTDHGQYLYEMLCLACGCRYAANGSDIHLRKCPECQGGRASTGGWSP